MLMGLKENQEKMSKSDPDSAIFMEDTAASVVCVLGCTCVCACVCLDVCLGVLCLDVWGARSCISTHVCPEERQRGVGNVHHKVYHKCCAYGPLHWEQVQGEGREPFSWISFHELHRISEYPFEQDRVGKGKFFYSCHVGLIP